MAKGWLELILPPPPYIFVKGTFNFCKLPQINGPKFKNAAQTKPPAGGFLGSGPGAGGMILPVQSPNRASRRCHRRRKKLPSEALSAAISTGAVSAGVSAVL